MSVKMEVDRPKLEPPVDKVIRRIVESKVNPRSIQFSATSRKTLGSAAKHFTVYLTQSMQDVTVRSELDQQNNSTFGFDLSALSKVYSIDPRLQHFRKYFPPVMEAEIAMELSRKRHKYLSGEIEEKVPKIEPKTEPTESKNIKIESAQSKSDEINSNSCNNTVIEHLEDSMSAVDISAESFPSYTSSAIRNKKDQTTEKKEKSKSKKQTNIQKFFAKKPKTT